MSFVVPSDAQSRSQWLQQMEKENGAAFKLQDASALGIPAEITRVLQQSDLNGDGKISWQGVWDALAATRKTTAATGLAKPVSDGVLYAGVTLKFPAGALREHSVQQDGLHLQMSDGTEARLARKADQWIITIDRMSYNVSLPTSGAFELRPMAADRPKDGLIRGHAIEVRSAATSWTPLGSKGSEASAVDGDAEILFKNLRFVARGAVRIEKTPLALTNEKATRITWQYADGTRVQLDFHAGRHVLQIGDERRVIPKLSRNETLTEIRFERPGTLTFTSVDPTQSDGQGSFGSGPTLRRFEPGVAEAITTVLVTKTQREQRCEEAVAEIGGGAASSIGKLLNAYSARASYDLVADPNHTRTLAVSLGRDAGAALAALARINPSAALTAQKAFLAELVAEAHPFGEESLVRLAIDSYVSALLAQPQAILPLLGELSQTHGLIGQLYLSPVGHAALSKLAEANIASGDLQSAQALYAFASHTIADQRTPLLIGTRTADAFTLPSPLGPVALKPLSDPSELPAFDGIQTGAESRALTRMKQIELTLLLTSRGLPVADRAIPPAPEAMQRYFASRYAGRMPAAVGELQKELSAYMQVAYVHPRLNVPDSLTAWGSSLPRATDGRLVADCMVMTRAAAQMIGSVPGLRLSPVRNDGHARLVVTTADGRAGFVQSNDVFVALSASKASLTSRVASTIAGDSRLQVMLGLPAPLALGKEISTDVQPLDVDTAFSASVASAASELAHLGGTAKRLRTSGDKVRPVMARFEAFRSEAETLYHLWQRTRVEDRTSALIASRDALRVRYEALLADVAALPTDPSAIQAFVREMKQSTGMFNIGDGARFLRGEVFPTATVGGRGLFAL